MSDALDMFRAFRPSPPAGDPDIRQPPPSRTGASDGRDLHGLAMVPGSAAYRARIPRPPCYRCGEDHQATLDYDHVWEAEPTSLVHDEPVSATAVGRRANVVDVALPSAAGRRVALYVGRQDTYVVAIEEAPDWDSVINFKVESSLVLPLINMARALGAKVADKTGGDLLMLEQEAIDARQHASTDDRSAATAGGDQPRRSGPVADRSPEDQLEPDTPTDGDVPGGAGGRRRPARRAQR